MFANVFFRWQLDDEHNPAPMFHKFVLTCLAMTAALQEPFRYTDLDALLYSWQPQSWRANGFNFFCIRPRASVDDHAPASFSKSNPFVIDSFQLIAAVCYVTIVYSLGFHWSLFVWFMPAISCCIFAIGCIAECETMRVLPLYHAGFHGHVSNLGPFPTLWFIIIGFSLQ